MDEDEIAKQAAMMDKKYGGKLAKKKPIAGMDPKKQGKFDSADHFMAKEEEEKKE